MRTRKQIDEEAILELVKLERRLQPRIGGRKLLVLLHDSLCEMGISIGRDCFFDLLRANGLLIERKRRRGPQTTYSRHGFRVYPNLLKTLAITAPHQAWVSDLTYIRTDEGFLYASLIRDAWSCMIVGAEGFNTLEATGSLRALMQAIRQLPFGAKPIHHSDRGIQYCSMEYVRSLESRGMLISMTEENHCYENAKAERLNGILKEEYGLGECFRTRAQARLVLNQAIWLYNTRRPHMSINYRIPSDVHNAAA